LNDITPTYFRYDDSRWLYKNRNEPRNKLNDTTSKAESDALLAWYLYTLPPEDSTSESSEMVMSPFHEYICNNSFNFMSHASLLQKQFLNLQELLQYGPPAMPRSPKVMMNPQSLCQPLWNKFEWRQIHWLESVERYHYNIVWEKFNGARVILRSCHAVFNSLRRICELAMTEECYQKTTDCYPTDYVRCKDEIKIRLFELKDWATSMDHFTPDCTDNTLHRLSNI
jgi:hypothetical protein